jgi:hypothetical protein
MGFETSIADNDLYRKQQVDNEGKRHYEYIIVYVNDIICISHNPSIYMDHIKDLYRLRGVGIPDKFLGSNINLWNCQDDDGYNRKCWAMGSKTYVQEAVRVMK